MNQSEPLSVAVLGAGLIGIDLITKIRRSPALDCRLVVGRDVSICAINIESPARYMTPSVTGLDTPNLSKLLGRCFDWFTSDRDWTGSRRLEPTRADVVHGESTGPTNYNSRVKISLDEPDSVK